MAENLRTTPFGPVERDLCTLASKRVSDSISSVLQLAPTQQASTLIALSSLSTAIAATAGALTAANPEMAGLSLFDVARVAIDIVEKTSKEAAHG